MKNKVGIYLLFPAIASGSSDSENRTGEIAELILGLPGKYKRNTCPVENYVPAFLACEYLGSSIQETGK